MFPTFPSGLPGIGLLLLRIGLGITLVAQGVAYVVDWRQLALLTWAVSLLALASSLALLIGYLTPFTGFLAALTSLGTALSWFPAPSPNLLDTRLAAALATIIALAIVCLGPGAFSLDARLFGRREIVIPNNSPPSES